MCVHVYLCAYMCVGTECGCLCTLGERSTTEPHRQPQTNSSYYFCCFCSASNDILASQSPSTELHPSLPNAPFLNTLNPHNHHIKKHSGSSKGWNSFNCILRGPQTEINATKNASVANDQAHKDVLLNSMAGSYILSKQC